MLKKGCWSGSLFGLLGVIAIIVGLGCGQLNARADYDIDNYRVKVNVREDGSAEVTQSMSYEFDDDYSGVFNVQSLKGIRGAKLRDVFTQVNNGAFKRAQPATSGQNNTYEVSQNKQRMRVKVYQQVEDDDVLQVGYVYDLYGLVTNYADTAELNWQIVGNGWDEPLHHVKITVQLPANQISKLQAWTHGPLDGQTKVDRKRGLVTMTVDRNPANQFIESHLLFPTSVTPANQQKSSKKRLAAVRKQEAKLAEQANQKRRQSRLIRVGVVSVVAAIWLIILVSYGVWFARHAAHRYPRPVPLNHWFEVPNVSPAAAQAMLSKQDPNAKALTGEILRGAAAGEYEITTVPGKRGKQRVLITKHKPVTNAFLADCFTFVAPDGTLDMADLKAFGKRDKSGKLAKAFTKWQKTVRHELDAYRDPTNIRWLQAWDVLTVLTLVVGGIGSALALLISGRLALTMTAVVGVVALICLIMTLIQHRQITRYIPAGLDIENQVGGLKRMMKDIGHFNTAEIGDLILWEQLLPYAAAFGLSKKVTDQLAIDFSASDLADNWILYYPLFYSDVNFDFSDVITSSFNGSISASSNSSSSGGSGGFSGGSSGGVGGGSGGGAF